jgi:hypothetical protein
MSKREKEEDEGSASGLGGAMVDFLLALLSLLMAD